MKNRLTKSCTTAFFSIFCAISMLTAQSSKAVEVAFEEDHSLPLVYLNMAVKTGAVSDPDGQSGVSNFMGEMLLRGTKHKTKEQIDLELDQMGATLGVEARSEALILRGAVLKDQLPKFLTLVQELVTESTFPENEMKKLKSEVISGILEELGRDQSLANRRFTRYLFENQPYGKPILGTRKDIENLSRDAVITQYDRLMRDKALLVVGSGDASESQIRTWANGIAANRAGGEDFAKVAAPVEPAKRRLLIVDKPERTQTQIYGGQVGIRPTDKDFFPLHLANHAFGGGSFSARMMTEIRVKRGWSYGAYSQFKQGRQPRSWSFYLFPAAKDATQALSLTLKMIEDLKQNGLKYEEFDFSKRSLVNSAGFMYNTPKKRVENKLLERTLDLPDGFMKSYGSKIQKVTLTDINAALKKFLTPESLTLTVLATAKDLREPLAKAAGVPLEEVKVVPYTQE